MARFVTMGSGRRFNPLDLKSEDIDIRDVAHTLSMICRFGGHTPRHYSVAEHSMLVAKMVPDSYQLAALLHDASEAYVGDVVRPVKYLDEMRGYVKIEEDIQRVIGAKYGVDLSDVVIGVADDAALYMEALAFFGREEIADWGLVDAERARLIEELPLSIPEFGLEHGVVMRRFLDAFVSYGGVL